MHSNLESTSNITIILKKMILYNKRRAYFSFFIMLFLLNCIFIFFIQPAFEFLHDGGFTLLFFAVVCLQTYFFRKFFTLNIIASVLINFLTSIIIFALIFSFSNSLELYAIEPYLRHFTLTVIYFILAILSFEIIMRLAQKKNK